MTTAADKPIGHPRHWARNQIESGLVHRRHNPPREFTRLVELCHAVAYTAGWWHDPTTGDLLDRNNAFDLGYIAATVLLAEPFSSASKQTDDVYVAGLFDGEGYIGVNRHERDKGFVQYTSRCQIASTDSELVDVLAQYGGNVSHSDAGKWNVNASEKWAWNIHGQQARHFLRRIGPLLRSDRKRSAARLVLAIELSRLPKGGMCRWSKEPEIHAARERAYQEIKRINSRLDGHDPLIKKNEVDQLADAFIRIADYAEAKGYDLTGAIIDKLRYNMERADHKPENRQQAHGKRF